MDIAASTAAINGTGSPVARELRLCDPYEVRTQYWRLIEDGVAKVRDVGSDGWLEGDVYASLTRGESFLYIGFVDNYYVGFVIVTPGVGWHGPILHIWALYNRGARDMLETFMPDMLAIARQRGARKITMASPRKGWERRAVQLGFEQGLTNFSLEV